MLHNKKLIKKNIYFFFLTFHSLPSRLQQLLGAVLIILLGNSLKTK